MNDAPEVLVKDVMTRQPVTVRASDSVEVLAKRMSEAEVGSVIVVDPKGNPVGIVTERDLLKRVTAKNKEPRKVKAREIMSAPLIAVSPTASVFDVARKMRQNKVRRLVVLEGGRMRGIVTTKDILDVTPAVVDILVERSKMSAEAVRETSRLAGRCDKCSGWSDNLRLSDGAYICEDCAADLEEGA